MACRGNRSVIYVRVPKLFDELAIAHVDGSSEPCGRRALIPDDWELEPPGPQVHRLDLAGESLRKTKSNSTP